MCLQNARVQAAHLTLDMSQQQQQQKQPKQTSNKQRQ